MFKPVYQNDETGSNQRSQNLSGFTSYIQPTDENNETDFSEEPVNKGEPGTAPTFRNRPAVVVPNRFSQTSVPPTPDVFTPEKNNKGNPLQSYNESRHASFEVPIENVRVQNQPVPKPIRPEIPIELEYQTNDDPIYNRPAFENPVDAQPKTHQNVLDSQMIPDKPVNQSPAGDCAVQNIPAMQPTRQNSPLHNQPVNPMDQTPNPNVFTPVRQSNQPRHNQSVRAAFNPNQTDTRNSQPSKNVFNQAGRAPRQPLVRKSTLPLMPLPRTDDFSPIPPESKYNQPNPLEVYNQSLSPEQANISRQPNQPTYNQPSMKVPDIQYEPVNQNTRQNAPLHNRSAPGAPGPEQSPNIFTPVRQPNQPRNNKPGRRVHDRVPNSRENQRNVPLEPVPENIGHRPTRRAPRQAPIEPETPDIFPNPERYPDYSSRPQMIPEAFGNTKWRNPSGSHWRNKSGSPGLHRPSHYSQSWKK